ncbi:hypothetical protein ILUMI_26243 [Ignelater luminosus]|uniref:Methyltransferase-like protein 22 n=1 Tax=Ignelater luminosus TaxID=2038154 RepID=A0A8K0FZA3_IGNLU|nr:hypothetical protein ILUMI_26243 [Ignelater luminosus]
MDDEDYKVSSELYTEFNYVTNLKPTLNKDNVVSKFPFTYPPKAAEIDSDGDLLVQRKSKANGIIEIEHSESTSLDLVGLQVWRGAFLLADWLLHNGENLPKNVPILELGSGTGLTSIVAAMYAPVICTDVDKGEILNLIKTNITRNKNITKYPVKVTEIDFTKDSLNPEVETILRQIQIVLAADVVYDDQLTQSFVKTMELILSYPHSRTIYIALEKRFVFTIADCDTVAPCYEYFLECINKLRSVTITEIRLDFPQYFQYDRVKELVLWKISNNK